MGAAGGKAAGRRAALGGAVMLVVALTGPPVPAYAAGTVTTSAQALRASIKLPSLATVPVTSGQSTWHSGGTAGSTNNSGLGVTGVLSTGVTTSSAGPVTGGGTAGATLAGLNLLGAVSADALRTSRTMSSATLSGGLDATNLTIAGAPVNPQAGLSVPVPGVLNATVDAETAVYTSTSGVLTYTVRGLDISLLTGSAVAGGSVVGAESVCSGVVRLGAVATTARTVTPGTSDTPAVTVTNTGDIATPNTVIRIPAPPTGWTVGPVTTTGGGTCSAGSSYVTCTGVTIPGGGTVTVSPRVTLAASGRYAADWAPAAGAITATSTPVAAVPATTLSVSGSGTLATAGAPQTTGGTITVHPATLAAGKTATPTVTVANTGPSDAAGSTITVPTGAIPAGVAVTSATVPGGGCLTGPAAITCSVTVPGSDAVTVSIGVSATTGTAPGTAWDLSGITAVMNGTAVTGSGRLLTVSDPDVNLTGQVTIGTKTAIPGGATATPTVTVRNAGIVPAPSTVITIPLPPAGYTLGPVTTSGGGACTTAQAVVCAGVTVPALSGTTAGQVVVSMPVTLASSVTAPWTGTVTAVSGLEGGQATGTVVTPNPMWTLGATAGGPAVRTVRPGQSTTMTVRVTDTGPSDAVNASFVVVAPASTVFGPAPSPCTALTPATVRCTLANQGAGATATTIGLALAVSASADATIPLTGGCVSLDDNNTCGDPGDVALPAITLQAPLASRLTVATGPATVVPGTAGTGLVELTSTQTETGLTVTVPTGSRPAGFTASGAGCTTGGSAITCAGVNLTAGQETDLGVRVAVASSVTGTPAWTVTGITVSDGTETVTVDGTLATAGTPAHTLTATAAGPADNTVQPGDTTALRVTAGNSGPSDVTGATVTVTAPTGTTFGAVPAPCTGTSSTLATCTVTLAAGASTAPITLPITVATGADPFTPLTGGCVDLDGQTGCGAADLVIPAINLKVPFNRQVSLSATAATVVPGSTATATVVVQAEHGAQSNLTVTVPLAGLPAGVTVAAAATGGVACPISGGTVTCSPVGAPSGGRATVALTVAATASTPAGGTWTATGITAGDGTDSITTDARLATVGAARPGLTAAVTAPTGRTEPGDTTAVGVTVTNAGPSDATAVTIGVIAPAGVRFGTAPAPCSTMDPADLSCPITLAANAPPLTLSLAVTIAAGADPATPITGGCVDLTNDHTCGTGDQAWPDIALSASLGARLTIAATAATVVPGTAGTARIALTSTQDETGLTLTVPTGAEPAGFTATSPGCTPGASGLTCTGIDLAAGVETDIGVRVAVASAVTPPQSWTATGVTVTDGGEQATADLHLADSGPVRTGLTATIAGPNDDTVPPGGTSALTVVVHNAGPSDATGATVTVTAPASTTFGALPAGCGATTPATATCPVTVAAGAGTPSIALPIAVDAAADPFTPLTGGCADVDGAPGCGSGDAPLAPIHLKVPLNREATITTTTAAVTPGTTGTATVGVSATHGDRHGLTVTVPTTGLPTGVTVAPADSACTAGPDAITCAGVDVPDGTTTALGLTVTAWPSSVAGSAWTANGITVSDGTDQITANARLATVGTSDYRLSATTTTPTSPIQPGGTGTVGVTVSNTGPSDATGVTIGVLAPAGVTLTAPSAPACTLIDATHAGCTLTVPASGSPVTLSVPITVDASATPGRPLAGGCTDLDNDQICGPGDVGWADIPVGTPFDQQVSVSTAPATVTPGRSGTAHVVIASDRAQTGLTVVIPLTGRPGQITLAAPSIDTTGTCTADATEIRCTGVGIPSAGAATVSIPVTVDAAAPATLAWSASTITVTDQDGGTVSGGGPVVTAGAATYRLAATVTGPAPDTVRPGTAATLTATLTDEGPSDATSAPVTVHAPAGTTFGAPAPAGCAAQSGGTVLACTVTLAAGAPAITWTLPVAVPGSADVSRAVTGGCLDLDGDNACGGPADVALPDIQLRTSLAGVLTITADNVTVTPGDTATATVTVAASQARSGLTIAVDTTGRPPGLTVDSASGPVSGDTVTCSNVSIAAGGTSTVTFHLSATAAAAAGTWSPDVTVTDGSDTATATPATATIGAGRHPVTVTVTPPADDTVYPGQTATLGVTVTNAGPSAYPGARFTFRAPDGTTFGALDPPAATSCTVTPGGTEAGCAIDLAVGSASFTLPVRVPDTADPATPVSGGCAGAEAGCAQPIAAFRLAIPLADEIRVSPAADTATPGTDGTGRVMITADRPLGGLTVSVPRTGLPPGFTITGAAGPAGTTCDLSGDPIVCRGVRLDRGGNTAVSVTVHTPSGAGPGVTWHATGITVAGAGPAVTADGDLVTTGAPVSGPVSYSVSAPPGPAEPGEVMSPTVTAANPGPSDAHVRYSVLAPAQTSFSPLPAATDQDCDRISDTRVDCSSTIAGGGSVSYAIPFTPIDHPDRSVAFQPGCVTGVGGDCAPGYAAFPGGTVTWSASPPSSGSPESPTPPAGYPPPDEVTLTADNPAIGPGSAGTTTLHVASSVSRTGLQIIIPAAGRADITISSVTAGATACPPAGDTFVCTIGTTAGVPSDLVIGFTVAADSAGGFSWSPSISIRQDGVQVTKTAVAATVTRPVAAITFTATGPGDGTTMPGDTAAVSVTAHNAGPADARPATLLYTAPTGTIFAAPADPRCHLSSDPTTMSCRLPLDRGAAVTTTLQIQVPATATPAARLTGGCAEATTGPACTPAATALPAVVLGTPLSAAATVTTGPVTVTPGLTGTGQVIVTATTAFSGLTLRMPKTLPDGYTLVSAAGPVGARCDHSGPVIVCTGVDLVAGPNTALSLTVGTASRLRAGASWNATGITLGATAADRHAATGAGPIAVTGAPVHPLASTVAGPVSPVAPGDDIALAFTITNPGPSDAIDQPATIVAPRPTTFGRTLSGAARRDCTRTSDTLLTCAVNQAANGPAIVWTVPLTVSATAADGSTLTGGCLSANGDPDCADAVDVIDPDFAVGRPLAARGHLALHPATVTPGDTGTATVVASATSDYDGVTLTVPLPPAGGLSVTAAGHDGADCAIGATTVVCGRFPLIANTPVTISLIVAADAGSAGRSWTPADVTLANDDDPTDTVRISGTLVTTAPADWTVNVSPGPAGVPSPAAGQTSVLPVTLTNAGPSDADPYTATFVLPAGLSPGPLPDGCAPTAHPRVIECRVTIGAGREATIRLPVTVEAGVGAGTPLTACLDADGDRVCGPGDTGLATLTVSAPQVDLTIHYRNPKPRATAGGEVQIELPYVNRGNTSAAGVTFTIDPPGGVTVVAAGIRLDASTAGASADQIVEAACAPDPDGDANSVVCTGPDAPVGTTSQLWLTLAVAAGTAAGSYPLTVTISTTSAEGDVVDNTATATLAIAPSGPQPPAHHGPGGPGKSGGPGGPGGSGSPLPTTGADGGALIALAAMLVAAGVTARVAARRKKTSPPTA